jgi:hypothetical protein
MVSIYIFCISMITSLTIIWKVHSLATPAIKNINIILSVNPRWFMEHSRGTIYTDAWVSGCEFQIHLLLGVCYW